MSSKFTHLHVHSHFSLLDGVNTIPAMIDAAQAYDMKALALTDHGNMYGAVEFYQRATRAGIKPIIGIEAYITDGNRADRQRDAHGKAYYHLVLLAENEQGYRNLLKLSSKAFIEGFYFKPRIDHEILAEHSEGLIGLSACLAGEVNRPLMVGDRERALEAAQRYQNIFAKDRFFLEIQDHGMPEQRRIIEQVPGIAKELGIPLVATNDIHYMTQDDARSQEVHLCISTGTTLDDTERMRFHTDQFYFRSDDEMGRLFSDFPEAVTNTGEIAALVDFQLDMDSQHLPVFQVGDVPSDNPVPQEQQEKDNDALFRKLVEEGLARHYPEVTPEIRKRVEYEVKVIEDMGFTSYFLITWDFIRYARDNGIPVGPGRGSAVGSIVSYCLGITNCDPIQHNLIFERFLNSERISMPDIDIDFCMDGREQVIEYVRRKYGTDRVAQIITFGTMAARAVIRDVGRVMGIPLKEIDAIAKKIPDTIGIKLAEALDQEPELKRLSDDARYQELFEVSLRLEGLNRHSSTHAAGVVIADQPLTDIVPLQRNGEDITTQFPMETLEQLGLLKMDFLGLRTLTILDRAIKIIAEETGESIDIDALPFDNKAAYELLTNGDTKGVFQLESSGMRELLRRLMPDRFEDIIAILALYRPGPLGSGMDKIFTERKHGREETIYLHEGLEPILGETYGVILYQEQVMRIAHDLAGFSMNEADSLRKAMGKKKPELIASFKEKFTTGAAERGVPAKVAKETFEQIEHFAKYGFNKSHSTAYAVISYQTAYFKANYPAALLAAVLSCEINFVEKMVEYLAECKRMNIEVRPPDINSSGQNFTVRQGVIHYGLVAVKGVGEKAVDAILAERDNGGAFRSLFDFTERVDLRQVNKTVVEQLIRCGAFDALGPSRTQLLAVVKAAIEEGVRVAAEKRAGQLSLFGGDDAVRASAEAYPEVPEASKMETLAAEKASLGFYLSGHPLDDHEDDLAPFRSHKLKDLAQAGDKSKVTIGVLIHKIRNRQTRKGDPMAILHVDDPTGSLEVIVFPQTYREQSHLLVEESVVLIRGDTEIRDDGVTVRADEIIPVSEAYGRLGKGIDVAFPVDETNEDDLFRFKDLVSRYRGSVPISLVFLSERVRWDLRPEQGLGVQPSAEMLAELRAMVGNRRINVRVG